MVPDCSVYFDVKSFSFSKKNPHKMSKPVHLQKLVQEKLFWCKCMIFTSKYSCTFRHLHSFHRQYSIFGHGEIFKIDNFRSFFTSLQSFKSLNMFSKSKSKRATKIKCDATSTKFLTTY